MCETPKHLCISCDIYFVIAAVLSVGSHLAMGIIDRIKVSDLEGWSVQTEYSDSSVVLPPQLPPHFSTFAVGLCMCSTH